MIRPELWVQIETAAVDNSSGHPVILDEVLYEAVNLVKYGHLSKEEAAIGALLKLSTACRDMKDERTRTQRMLLEIASTPNPTRFLAELAPTP